MMHKKNATESAARAIAMDAADNMLDNITLNM
jgi:hypothetical protein